MRADNQGEGGILALLALAQEAVRSPRARNFLVLLAIGGAALFYGDSMITPAISVLSAIEGIGVGTPALNRFVVPITVVVLVALFLLQKRGTEKVGSFFGPVMLAWFAVIGVDGLIQIAEAPRVLAGVQPGPRRRGFCRLSAAGLYRARCGVPRDHRRRGALRRYGPFRPVPDQARMVRAGVARPRAELFRTGRLDSSATRRRSRTRSFAWCPGGA